MGRLVGESNGTDATTATRLLEAASKVSGGDRALARLLGLSEILFSSYRYGLRPLPDHLLLRAVDVLLEARERRPSAQAGISDSETKSSTGLQ
jgi:hypothetical protein